MAGIARQYLGHAYNPLSGEFGRTCVLTLGPEDIEVVQSSSHQFEQIFSAQQTTEDKDITTTRLRADFEMREIVPLSSYYSTSRTLQSSVSSVSQLYVIKKITATANVTPLKPRLSEEMINVIRALPRWSPETVGRYEDFFHCYGTHVVISAALGGVLRIVKRGDNQVDNNLVERALMGVPEAPIFAQSDTDAKLDTGSEQSGRADISVFRDGGRAVANELSGALEQLFSYPQCLTSQAHLEWTKIRMRWIEALETDPVFCPDDPHTQFWWLYSFDGLTDDECKDLKLGSKLYLEARENEKVFNAPGPSNPRSSYDSLPRQENAATVLNLLTTGRSRWQSKFRKWVNQNTHVYSPS